MYAYELLAKLNKLMLVGQNEDGDLEWMGDSKAWRELEQEEQRILTGYQIDKLF